MTVTCTIGGCPNEGIAVTLPDSDVVICGGCQAVLHDPHGLALTEGS